MVARTPTDLLRDFNESTKVATFFGKLTWDFATHSCEFSGELQDNKAYSAKVIFASSDDPVADEEKANLAFLQWLEQPLPGTRISRKKMEKQRDGLSSSTSSQTLLPRGEGLTHSINKLCGICDLCGNIYRYAK